MLESLEEEFFFFFKVCIEMAEKSSMLSEKKCTKCVASIYFIQKTISGARQHKAGMLEKQDFLSLLA